MTYEMRTRSGHNMYDMASMMQKAIRRCDINRASYAAYELYGNYSQYMWRRLLVISAEDCYGIITKEIVGLMMADEVLNKNRKGYEKETIFLGKAIYLLCIARKNRDGCYVACNYILADRNIDFDEIPNIEVEKEKLYGEIPDWVFDNHTLKGKKAGRTRIDMTIEEENALQAHQYGLFDDCSWGLEYESERKKGNLTDKEWNQYLERLADKIADPTPGLIMDDRDESVIKVEKIKELFNKGNASIEEIKKIIDSKIE